VMMMIIIIITDEKIKVMLSRKCCRGTLQDYNKGEISERKIMRTMGVGRDGGETPTSN